MHLGFIQLLLDIEALKAHVGSKHIFIKKWSRAFQWGCFHVWRKYQNVAGITETVPWVFGLGRTAASAFDGWAPASPNSTGAKAAAPALQPSMQDQNQSGLLLTKNGTIDLKFVFYLFSFCFSQIPLHFLCQAAKHRAKNVGYYIMSTSYTEGDDFCSKDDYF